VARRRAVCRVLHRADSPYVNDVVSGARLALSEGSWGHTAKGEEVRLQRDMTHRTVARAKRAAAREHTPVIVRLRSGRYDWYPSGNGIPFGSRVVSRWSGERWIDGP
jgi:hypothetical protein